MKDSGVAWLGKIPSSWPQKHARYLFRESKVLVGDRWGDYELLSLTLRGIIPRSEVEGGKNPEKYDAYQIVRDNDLVMCLFDYDVTPRTVGRVTQTGMLTGAYTNLKPYKGVSTRYYNYFFLSLDSTKELLHLCTGLRNGISKPVFFGLNLPFPNYDTQEKIADFLDTETAQIDNLIAKQERLLELLEEKRRATITHAVTRGLNPSVELKETNIPWLGQVPAHWNVNPLFKYVKENKRSNKGMVNENVLTLSYGKIKEKNLDNGGLMPESFETYQIVKPGDIILRLTDLQNDKTSLRVGHSNFEGIITSAYVDISSVSYKSKYLYYLLHAYDLMKVFYNLGAGLRQGMKFSDLKRLPAFGVKQDEQQQIIDYLESYERKTDELKQKIQTQITLLRERRTSLISHAVTGKIKI
jgi:type I restriction enzyme S subunit